MSKRNAKRIHPLSAKGLLFMSIAVVAPLVALELLVRLFWNQSTGNTVLNGPRIDLTEEGYHHYHPGAEWLGVTPEFQVHYKISPQGFRDRVIHEEGEPSNADEHTRFLVLGDSFTAGVGSNYEETFLYRLEEAMQERGTKATVIKAGVEAYNQYLEYHYLVELYERFPSPIVMICFLPNDLFDNRPVEWQYQRTKMSAIATRKKRKFQLQMIQAAKAVAMNIDPLYLSLYERTGRGVLFERTPAPETKVEEQLATTRDLLKAINNFCREKGARLIVVSIPQLYQVLKEPDAQFDPGRLDQVLSAFAEQEGFDWIETQSAFREAALRDGKRTHFRVDGHLTPAGNEILAAFLVKSLEPLLTAP